MATDTTNTTDAAVDRRGFVRRGALAGAGALAGGGAIEALVPSFAAARRHHKGGVTKGDLAILGAAQIAEALAVTTYTNIIDNAPSSGTDTLNVLVTLEDAFIAAYLVGVRDFSTLDLRVTAACVRALHAEAAGAARRVPLLRRLSPAGSRAAGAPSAPARASRTEAGRRSAPARTGALITDLLLGCQAVERVVQRVVLRPVKEVPHCATRRDLEFASAGW